MCAAHPSKWGNLSPGNGSGAAAPVGTVCELRDRYIRADERRQFPRLPLNLQVSVRRVGDRLETEPIRARTSDISCGGLSFHTDRKLEAGATLDLEVLMAEQPLGGPSIRMYTRAHVVRLAPAGRPGWTDVGAVFDDILFDRDPSGR